MVSLHTESYSLSAKLRMKRMRFLDELILSGDRMDLSLVDMGGTRSFWEMNLKHLKGAARLRRIDIYNLEVESETTSRIGSVEIREMQGNVTQLDDVTDNQYDVAFSNSVVEHVGNLCQQYLFAQEIQRVAPYYVLQTPNRYFPLEPHFYVPFFPFIPLGIRTALHRRFRLGWYAPEPDELKARIDCDEIRLLTRKELALLFPKAGIRAERLGGLVKSFIIVGKAGK
ncbi:MAG: methyltransferase domain-containing protein [Kiritimatiellales bacterium]|nr:methyltransferase domain-containing protein [Kiritimatiellales bacterium]